MLKNLCFVALLSVVSSEGVEDGRSAMRCMGTASATRRCHFQNLYWNAKTRKYHFFGIDGEGAHSYGHEPGSPDEPFLALGR